MLKSISPLDGRYNKKLTALSEIFSEYGLIKYRFIVEVEWLLKMSTTPGIRGIKLSHADKRHLKKLANQFSESDAKAIKKIERKTNHDVKAVEVHLQNIFAAKRSLKPYISFIHFGCTSEDINNLAYSLMLKDGLSAIVPALEQLIKTIKQMAKANKNVAMLARTHGQAASPTTLSKELINVVYRLDTQVKQLKEINIYGKFNGATGNFNAHMVAYPKVDWLKVSQSFVSKLGLEWNPLTTQIEPHDGIAQLMHGLSRINTILLDFDKDMWGYISINYFSQKPIKGEVGSSTMPHKINPIDFENAEGNLGIANALALHLASKLPVSRWQRDLTDSTVLRNLGVVFAHSLLAYQATQKGLSKLAVNKTQIKMDLNKHWEVLTEAVQTVMRAHGIADSYEQLKAFSRGQAIDKQKLHAFIKQSELPDRVKTQLLKLTPASYIGLANKLQSGLAC